MGKHPLKKSTTPVENSNQSKKRQKRNHETQEEPPVEDPKSLLACKALAIVLQHSMVPNLGWSMNTLEKRSLKAKQATEKFLENCPDPLTKKEKNEVKASMESTDPNKMGEASDIIITKRLEKIDTITDFIVGFNVQVRFVWIVAVIILLTGSSLCLFC